MFSSANIARHLAAYAAAHPAQAALKIPRGRRSGRIEYLTLSYAELAAEVAAQRARLAADGLRPGDRTLVMVRQGLPLLAVVFALFELGAVPVVIDPGMGRKSFLRCVAHSRPRALVGIPAARLAARVFRAAFRSVELRIAVSGSNTARLTSPGAVRPADAPSALECSPEDLAAILFTSGSTGAPKGVCYTHGQFDAQVGLIRETYGIEPGEVDLPLLPLFALFAPALGMTTIVPELDPSRPARADPAKLVQAILQEGVTTSFGSPTLWGNLAAHCQSTHQTLPSLRRVLCAGAPVPPWLWETLSEVMPRGVLHSPYGATEVLPVSTISAADVVHGTALETLRGGGVCVGRVLPQNLVKIIAPSDGPIARLEEARELAAGEVGEIIVTGPSVTKNYDALPEADALAKIAGADGAVWHRMGDLGRFDSVGRLWFCGRKVETVHTGRGPLYPACVEPLFDIHNDVRRCALIGLGPAGGQRPALVIEPNGPELIRAGSDCRRLARELRAIALRHEHTTAIKVFYFREALPVDVRHNAKIHRLTLARWAAEGAVGHESDPKR
ncbi:MAG: fatty acid CoA ligase family protein [Verrucomicrobia bacterium]|nr:fatty acid CoA ligase family protein [Verrucomicrobiota bacterium]